jgi:hypothetical protein
MRRVSDGTASSHGAVFTWQTFPPKSNCAQRGSEKSLGLSGTFIVLRTAFHIVMACFDISVERSILFVRDKLRRSLGDTRPNICVAAYRWWVNIMDKMDVSHLKEYI